MRQLLDVSEFRDVGHLPQNASRSALSDAGNGDEQLALPPQRRVIVEKLLNFVSDAFELTRKMFERGHIAKSVAR